MNVQIPQNIQGDTYVPPAVPAQRSAPAATAGSVPQVEAPAAPQQKASSEQVQAAIENLKRASQSADQNLQFSVDGETGQTVIKVVDGGTKEVIRQIPSEEVLQLAKSLDKISGMLFSQKA